MQLGGEAGRELLRRVPGIGVWTAAEVAQRAWGDPDAVSVGDFHIPALVGWALLGRPIDDAQMLQVLGPYAPQRARAVRYVELSGFRKPRFGPRFSPRDYRAIVTAPRDLGVRLAPTPGQRTGRWVYVGSRSTTPDESRRREVTVLVGGVGGARFLLGVKAALGLPAVGAGPDAGPPARDHRGRQRRRRRVDARPADHPDLDSCLYTLGGGIDPERGWGRAEETWTVREELAAYGAEPSWFALGDRDIATHLVRTRMLRAGYRLSDVVTAPVPPLAAGRDAAARHRRPRRDPRRRRRPRDRPRREAGDPLPGVVGPAPRRAAGAPLRRRSVPTRRRSCRPRADAIARRRRRAARAVQPGGEHRGAAGDPRAARRPARHAGARVVGLSPIVGGRPVRGMADACLPAIGVETTAEAVGRHYGARAEGGLLDGWLVHTGDTADVPGAEVRSGAAAHERRRRDRGDGRAPLDLCGAPGWLRSRITGPRAACRSCPCRAARVPPGDDLAAALADRGAVAGRRRRRRRHQQDRVQGRGPARGRAHRPRRARRAAPRARRRRERAGARPPRRRP